MLCQIVVGLQFQNFMPLGCRAGPLKILRLYPKIEEKPHKTFVLLFFISKTYFGK